MSYAPHSPHPDDPYWRRWIARHGADTWANLGRLPDQDPARARDILRDLAEHACTCQHMANINLGRWGALAMPRAFVVAELPPILAAIVAAGSDWEYRRALELATLVDRAALVPPLVEWGRASADAEVREAAIEFSD